MKKRFFPLALALSLTLAAWLGLTLPAARAAEDFDIVGGVLTKYNGPSGDVVVPDGVTRIGEWAFSGCKNLTSVNIPNSVTSIGDYAFKGCISLTSVTIPDSVTRIGEEAFSVSGLTTVTIPSSVTSIGDHAFQGCKNLTSATVPDNVTSYGKDIFAYCTNLVLSGVLKDFNIGDGVLVKYKGPGGNVVIPDGVTTIGKMRFRREYMIAIS